MVYITMVGLDFSIKLPMKLLFQGMLGKPCNIDHDYSFSSRLFEEVPVEQQEGFCEDDWSAIVERSG